jgi:hypothetical protein
MASPKSDPPLINLQVTNPVTYIKLWWKKILGNEGIDIRFKIRPFTAIALTVVLLGTGFGLGRFTLPASSPLVQYIPELGPTPPPPTPDPWKDTAYTGILKQSGTSFYLVTNEAEAITLQVPTNVNLSKSIGKRILAVGRYNKLTEILHVTDASDLEVLIQSAPVAITSPTPISSPQQ